MANQRLQTLDGIEKQLKTGYCQALSRFEHGLALWYLNGITLMNEQIGQAFADEVLRKRV